MKNNFQQRLRILSVEGTKIGAKYGFLNSFFYTLVFVVFENIRAIIINSTLHESFSLSKLIAGSIAIGFVMFIFGIIPTTIVGGFGGAIIGFFIAFWKDKVQIVWACLIGLGIGSAIVLLADYISYLYLIAPYPSFYESFSQYLSPPSDLDSFASGGGAYFIPTIIAILMSPYIAWRISNKKNELSGIHEK